MNFPQQQSLYAGMLSSRTRGLPADGLVFYHPTDSMPTTLDTGQEMVYATQNDVAVVCGIPCIYVRRGTAATYCSPLLDSFGGIVRCTDTDSILPAGGADRTVCAWAFVTGTSSYVLVSYGTAATNKRFSLAFNPTSGHIYVYGYTNTASVKLTSPTSTYKWFHVLVTFHDNTIYAYLNGVYQGSGKFPSNIDTIPAMLTLRAQAESGSSSPLYGLLGRPRIYNRVLSDVEIEDLYNLENTVSDLMFHAPFNESMASLPTGQSIVHDDAVYSVISGMPCATTDGVSQYIGWDQSEVLLPVGTMPRTICGWLLARKGASMLIDYGAAYRTYELYLVFRETYITIGHYTDVTAQSDMPIQSNENVWYHIALVTTGSSTFTVYRDGAELGSVTIPNYTNLSTTLYRNWPGVIGARLKGAEPSTFYNVSAADIKVYFGVRTRQQIKEEMLYRKEERETAQPYGRFDVIIDVTVQAGCTMKWITPSRPQEVYWGDDTEDELDAELSSISYISHTYTEAGTYRICLPSGYSILDPVGVRIFSDEKLEVYTVSRCMNCVSATILIENVEYLPPGFHKVDYLESTGTQWIDTGLIPTSDTLVVDSELQKTGTKNDMIAYGILKQDNITFNLNLYSSTSAYFRYLGREFVKRSFTPKNKHLYSHGSDIYIDGAYAGSISPLSSFSDNHSHITLFSNPSSVGVPTEIGTYPFIGRVFSWKCREDSVTTADYIPCVLEPNTTYIDGNTGNSIMTTDFKPGMYDIVTGRLFVNQSTTGSDFIYPEIV